MKHLHSISPITKVFETNGSRPVLVEANDLNQYVCKYYNGGIPARMLVNEVIATEFLRIWEIKTPNWVIIDVKQQHISNQILNYRTKSRYFNIPCFGSQYLFNAKEVDKTWENMENIYEIIDLNTYIEIALFDVWIANEDRNPNNYNLLIQANAKGKYELIPIDHTFIFNTNSMHYGGIYEISFEESLMYSPIFVNLIRKNNFSSIKSDSHIERMMSKIKICEDTFETIINKLPLEWGCERKDIDLIKANLFNSEWKDRVRNTYLAFCEEIIKFL